MHPEVKKYFKKACSKAGKSRSEKKLRAINENLKKARANRWPDKSHRLPDGELK